MDEEKLNTLIGSLEKLVKAIEKSGSPGGSGSSDSASILGDTSSRKEEESWAEDQIKQRDRAIKQRKLLIKDLEEEKEARGELSRQKQSDLDIARDEIGTLEEFGDVTADNTTRMGEMSSALEDQAKKSGSARKATAEYTKGLTAGSDKLNLAAKNAMKFGGEAQALTKFLPTSTAEIISMGQALLDKNTYIKATILLTQKLIAESINMAFAMDKASASFHKETGAFQEGNMLFNDTTMEIQKVDRATRVLGWHNQRCRCSPHCAVHWNERLHPFESGNAEGVDGTIGYNGQAGD